MIKISEMFWSEREESLDLFFRSDNSVTILTSFARLKSLVQAARKGQIVLTKYSFRNFQEVPFEEIQENSHPVC